MENKSEINPYTWLLALAVGVLGSYAVSAWQYNEVQSAIGILALVDKKGLEDINALRQELASQRELIDSLKAASTTSGAKAPSAPATASEAAPAAAAAKAKPHR
jgi:hypothetical protein